MGKYLDMLKHEKNSETCQCRPDKREWSDTANSRSASQPPEKTERSNNSVFSGRHLAISKKNGFIESPHVKLANAIADLPTTAEEVLKSQVVAPIDLVDISAGRLSLINVRLLVASWILGDKYSTFQLNHDYPRLLGVSRHPRVNDGLQPREDHNSLPNQQ